jgi:hypothetical protein
MYSQTLSVRLTAMPRYSSRPPVMAI